MNKKVVWIATSRDEYRLIEYVTDSAGAMARHYGVDIDTVFSANAHYKKDGKDRRFIRVEYDEDDNYEDLQGGV